MPSLSDLISKVRVIHEVPGAAEAAQRIRDVASAQREVTKASVDYQSVGNVLYANFNNLRTAAAGIVQQNLSGPLGQWAVGLAAVGAAYVAATAGAALFVKAVKDGIEAYTKFEEVQTTTKNLLQATAYSSGLTAAAVDKIAVSLGGNIDQARAATQALLQFTNVGGSEFERATVLAQKLAASGFGSIASEAQKMGRFLSDEQGAMKSIGDAIYSTWGFDKVQRIEEMSNAIEKQRAKLDLLEQSLKGVQSSPISTAWDNLTSAIQRGSEQFGEGAARVLRVANAINALATAVNYLNSLDLSKAASVLTAGALGGPVGAIREMWEQRNRGAAPTPELFGMGAPEGAIQRMAQWNAAANKAAGLIKEYEDIAQRAAQRVPTMSYSYNTGDMRTLQYEQQIEMARQELSLVNQTAGAQEEARRTLQAYYQLRQDSLRTGNPFDQNAFNQIVRYNVELGRLVDAREKMMQISQAIEGPLVSGLTDIVGGSKRAGDAFRDMANTIIRNLEQMIIKMMIIQPLMQSISSFSGSFMGGGGNAPGASSNYAGYNVTGLPGSAMGNVFDRGNIIPFARGGVVNRPTLFPMAGGAGLMGEAGPEAVMPLRRGPDGRLGVAGGSKVNIVVNNLAGADVAAQPRQGADGSMDIEITINRAVKNALMSDMANYGPMSQGMARRFGLDPTRGAA